MRNSLRRLRLRPVRTWVPAGIAFGLALLLASAYWNVPHLVVLRDHPLSAVIFWPAAWVLLAAAVTLLLPAGRRSGPAVGLVFGVTGLVVICGSDRDLGLASSFVGGGSANASGELVDSVSSADGRYQVQVFHWQAVLGEDGWDFVVQRRDGLRGGEAYAGCLFSEGSARYQRIEVVEAGTVRIATDEGPVSLAFDPKTMHVTRPIPADLCLGYD